jgi:hypothetical protein
VVVVFRRCAWRGSAGVAPLKGREGAAETAGRRGPDAVRRWPASRAAASAALRAPLRARCILACGAWGTGALFVCCVFSLLLVCLFCFGAAQRKGREGKGTDGQDRKQSDTERGSAHAGSHCVGAHTRGRGMPSALASPPLKLR